MYQISTQYQLKSGAIAVYLGDMSGVLTFRLEDGSTVQYLPEVAVSEVKPAVTKGAK